jgi:hypothetical protein
MSPRGTHGQGVPRLKGGAPAEKVRKATVKAAGKEVPVG